MVKGKERRTKEGGIERMKRNGEWKKHWIHNHNMVDYSQLDGVGQSIQNHPKNQGCMK
jgi:hypothetical protein